MRLSRRTDLRRRCCGGIGRSASVAGESGVRGMARQLAVSATGRWAPYSQGMLTRALAVVIFLLVAFAAVAQTATDNSHHRAPDLGLKVGILPSGPLDAITDVAGVEVGHSTIISGDNIRTGVTAVL